MAVKQKHDYTHRTRTSCTAHTRKKRTFQDACFAMNTGRVFSLKHRMPQESACFVHVSSQRTMLQEEITRGLAEPLKMRIQQRARAGTRTP